MINKEDILNFLRREWGFANGKFTYKSYELYSLEDTDKFEEKVLFEKIKPEDFVILLDEKGKTLSSIEFSKTISNIQQSGKKQALFVIGGAYGVSDSVKKRAQLKQLLPKNHKID